MENKTTCATELKVKISDLMLHSCDGLVCVGLLWCNLTIPHTRSALSQGSVCVFVCVCVSSGQFCGNWTSHLYSYERHAVQRKPWFSDSELHESLCCVGLWLSLALWVIWIPVVLWDGCVCVWEDSLRSSVSGPFVLSLYCSELQMRLSGEALNGKSISDQ